MRILILGGTRFIGKKILNNLLDSSNEIWVISRRNFSIKNKIIFLNMERNNGINALKDKEFDLTIDFIAYEEKDIANIYNKINSKRYILISTTWITRLWEGKVADEFKLINKNNLHLSEVTKKYLIGKYQCEKHLLKLIESGFNAKIIRFPIVLGNGDHTRRLDFYLERIMDNKPIIQIKDHNNKVQIACLNNLSNAFIEWINICEKYPINIWEALPNNGLTSRELIKSMAISLNREIEFIDIPKIKLEENLPEFLISEPFWKEKNLDISKTNIYKYINLEAKSFYNCAFANKVIEQTDLRKKEINYFAKYL